MSQSIFTLTLKDFKSWSDLKINFPLNGVTLLKGVSGVGKTTILEAIYWCLYDTVKQVAPFNITKCKTCVELKYHNIVIRRSKNPNKLFFIKDNITFEDQAAQEMINKEYGTHYVWLSSCYIPQGQRNVFTSLSNESKIKVLNEIAFHEENPEETIDKITSYLQQQKIKYDIKLNDFKSVEEEYKNVIDKYDITKLMNEEQYNNYLNSKSQLQDELEQVTKIINSNNMKMVKIETLRQNLNKQVLRDIINIDVDKIKDENKMLREQIEIYNKKKEKERELSKLKYDPNLLQVKVNDDILQQVIIQESRYNMFINNCNKLDVKPNDISLMIEEMEHVVECNKYIIESSQYFTLIDKLNNLNIDKTRLEQPLKQPVYIENEIKQVVMQDTTDLNNELEQERRNLISLSNDISKLEHM